MALNTAHDIERAIDGLTPEQLEELYQWLDERHPQPVDLQLKADLNSGRFEDRISRALAEHEAGASTSLEHRLNVNPFLWQAIEETRMVRLRYKSRERILEPHDYGIRKGKVMLLALQTGGSSSNKLPGWRWMEVDMISDIELLNQTFRGGRPAPSGVHQEWQEVFIRAKPHDHDASAELNS